MPDAQCAMPDAQRPMRANTGLTQAQCPMTERNLVPANAAYSSGCPMQASGGPMQASGCPMQAATEEGLRLAASPYQFPPGYKFRDCIRRADGNGRLVVAGVYALSTIR